MTLTTPAPYLWPPEPGQFTLTDGIAVDLLAALRRRLTDAAAWGVLADRLEELGHDRQLLLDGAAGLAPPGRTLPRRARQRAIRQARANLTTLFGEPPEHNDSIL